MTPEEAFSCAEKHIKAGMVADKSTFRETNFGFYFYVASEEYLRTKDIMKMPIGSHGVLVDRETGEVHWLGSSPDLEYWLEAYDCGLHQALDVVVTSVGDRQRAASALSTLQMSYVIPEIAYGETWKIPKPYKQKDFLRAFDSLPARFESQQLILRMYELDAIAESADLDIVLEPSNDRQQTQH